jgi:nucleotide-binding universal stress UspA family protein
MVDTLAARPARLDRLVIVGNDPEPPGWVRDWTHRAARHPRSCRLPATTPGHRPTVNRLLDTVAPLTGDPVLVIPPDAADPAPHQVTVALHALPDDAPVLAAAADTGRKLGAALVVTHGLPTSFAERSVGLACAVEHARQLLATAARQLTAAAPDLAVITQLVRVHPHELVGEQLDTGLLVIGLLVIGGPRRDIDDDLGLVARTALHHATCPVLLVPR